MKLVELWQKNRASLEGKSISQIIGFAADGKLGEDSAASSELRDYLRNIPSNLLETYADQCLEKAFEHSGFALQDLVNEIGRRLGFTVTHGRYQGTRNEPGHDGLWADGGKHNIVVEVKTTDAYSVDLNRIAGYRQQLAQSGTIDIEKSSMLVVVGRQDTGGLEAQIRGSRYAWDMRIISVEALFRMLKLKEEVEDPTLVRRIHEMLVPREFTRLDPIVEIAFAAVEDVKQEPEAEGDGDTETEGKRFAPVAFHSECISRIEKILKTTLVKRSRASFITPDEQTRVLCAVSRWHERNRRYWFAFHPHQREFLAGVGKAFAAFGCGGAETIFLIPFADFEPLLAGFNRTECPGRSYWHVQIKESRKLYWMVGRAGTKDFEITKYRI